MELLEAINTLTNARTDLAELYSAIDDVAVGLVGPAAELSASRVRIADLEAERDAARARVADLEAEADRLRARIADLEADPDPDPDPGPDPDPEPEPDPPDPEHPSLLRHLIVFGPEQINQTGPLSPPLDGNRNPIFELTDRMIWAVASARPRHTEGAAPFRHQGGDEITVRLASEDLPSWHGGATAGHALHLPYDRGYPETLVGGDLNIIDTPTRPFDPGRSGKFWGAVGFNHYDWSRWPGGGNHDPANFSCRITHEWFNRTGTPGPAGRPDRWSSTDWRLCLYVYTGGPDADSIVVEDLVDPSQSTRAKRLVHNNGHTLTAAAIGAGAPPVNTWFSAFVHCVAGRPDLPNGTATLYINAEPVLRLSGIRWSRIGPRLFDRAYISHMIGWNGGDSAPKTPDGAVEYQWRRFHASTV